MSKDFKLIYILGAGHSGSTLLNLLLNGHSCMLGLSEVSNMIPARLFKEEVHDNPLFIAFWHEVKRRYETFSGQPFADLNVSHNIYPWNTEDLAKWAQKNFYLMTCIAEESGAKFLIDSSKSWRRLYLLQQSGLFDIKVIHIIRDGRGVINSYIRKYNHFHIGLQRWAKPTLMALYLRRKFQATEWLEVRYEELAMTPEITLQNISAFLGVDYEPAMLSYRQHLYIGIGGNRMAERRDERIFLDERWRRELSRSHLIMFMLLGNWLNKYLGY